MHACNASYLVLTLPFLVCCSAESTTDEAEQQTTDEAKAPTSNLDFRAFDEAVGTFVKEHGLEGAGAIVVHRELGSVHERAYGTFAGDRLYLLASTSKVISAGVIMRLADQGVVDLDGPIGKYAKEWGEGKEDLTLAQLLSNSSGLLGLSEPLYGPYLCQFGDGTTLTDCARYIYQADDAASRVSPDTEFRYGGAQWQLAGGIAEMASGKSWAELVEETYAEPCEIDHVGYTNHFGRAFASGGDLDSAFRYPSFFQGEVGNLPRTENPNIEGGGYATVSDYGALLLMHLRKGLCGDERVLSERAVARMQADRVAKTYHGSTGGDLAGYGLGWFVDREHPGVVVDPGAYGAMAWLDGTRGYGAFVVIEDEDALGHELREIVTPILAKAFDDAAR